MNMSNSRDDHSIVNYLPDGLMEEAKLLFNELGEQINEIRLRVGRTAVAMLSTGQIYYASGRTQGWNMRMCVS